MYYTMSHGTELENVLSDHAEVIEAALLASERGDRRPGGLLLERPLFHPRLASVLLGVSRLDQLGVDAQSDPPDAIVTRWRASGYS